MIARDVAGTYLLEQIGTVNQTKKSKYEQQS